MHQQDFHQEPANKKIFSRLGIGEKNIVTVRPESTLQETLRLMKEKQIGNVVVVEDKSGAGIPVGILTDRDIALKAFDHDEISGLKVSDLMTPSPTTASIECGPFEMIRLMKENGITRLILVDDNGALVGLVNAKRLIQLFVEGLSDLAHISDAQKEREASTFRAH